MTTDPRTIWPIDGLYETPSTRPAPNYGADDLEALFIDGFRWSGGETRLFAYVGMPERTSDEPVPGMVLVHGGGGQAFAEWVRIWTARGYAAIAIDWYGGVPNGGEKVEDRLHEWRLPPMPGFHLSLEAIEEQWAWHATSGVIRAHSLLRSWPGVDPNRIGLTGISWGGYLTSFVSGLDPRFSFAAPVYGCGCLGEGSAWVPDFERIGKEKADRWLELWDPTQYVGNADLPMLWVSGTNDFAYTPHMLSTTARLNRGENRYCIRVRMPHGHVHGWSVEEIGVFADARLKRGEDIVRIAEWDAAKPGAEASATYESPVGIVRAEMNYTCDAGKWQDREWKTDEARLDTESRCARAVVPEGATAWYMNLFDERNLASSTEFAGV